MAVLVADIELDSKLFGSKPSLMIIAKNVEVSAKEYLLDLKLVTDFTIEDSLVKIFTAERGSVVNLRVFPKGLVSLSIDYYKGDKENSSASYELLQKIEVSVNNKVEGVKSTKVVPNISAERIYRYYVTSDSRVLEYDVDKVVFEEKTPYQKVQIVQSKSYGNILVLDDLQNLSEADLIYTETLMQRGKEDYKDKEVLILGGGDGALLYELLKENPKEVIMLEIDDVVMKACAKHMRSVCGDVLDSYDAKNYKIIVGDCMPALEQYAKEGKKFDYIFGDLTDVPISPDHSKELWDFIDKVLKLSFKVLKSDGKFMTHVTGVNSPGAIKSYEKHLLKLKPAVKFTTDKAYVPSFIEEWFFCQVSFADQE